MIDAAGNDVSAKPAGDGMPIGNELTPDIQGRQVEIVSSDGARPPQFDDDAAATITWQDYRYAQQWLDTNSWLAEWQYIDYLYQSPTYDRDWRQQTNRPARISRFNIAKNRNTMSNQVRRGIFAEERFFMLKPIGKLAQMPSAETYVEAWTELLLELCSRADFEYQFTLLIECMVLQGTGIGNAGWETRNVIKKTRTRQQEPAQVDLPDGTTKKIDTWESDDLKVREQTVEESWPFFEYRRLGTTLYDPKWRTPNRPDISAGYKIDVDYVTFQDLQQMRTQTCYKDLPSDEELKKFFLDTPDGDAQTASQVAQAMNTQSSVVLHAEGEHKQTSEDPFVKPMMKIARWTGSWVTEILVYESRMKVIRNEEHFIAEHALGYSANWWNIDNSGYGLGIGRLNAGDQRMDQGVLNEVLKMIAFPMNAPILYDASDGNAPTENVVVGMGTFWGIQNPPGGDINKAFGFLKTPSVPPEAWQVYQLGKDGGEDLVGANSTTMQGNLGGRGSSAMRTAAGVNRVGGKADENISDPIYHLEGIINRFLMFLVDMVREVMPLKEIRYILAKKFSDAVIQTIDPLQLLDIEFSIKVLAGQKLQAKANMMQLLPFLIQFVQQPQLMQFMHEKGETVNFAAIEEIFMQVSELAGRGDIIVPLTPQQRQMVAQMNPNAMKAQVGALLEKLKGQNKLAAIAAQGKQDMQKLVTDKAMDHVEGAVPLELAEARDARNTDLSILQNGFPGAQ